MSFSRRTPDFAADFIVILKGYYMKIGKYPVKHSYKISRMIADVFSAALIVLIISGTVSFFVNYGEMAARFGAANAELSASAQEFIQSQNWRCAVALIFPALAAGVVAAYVVLTLKSHEFSGYSVTKLTAQKYYDLYAFIVSLCKIPALLGIFDLMYITHRRLLGDTEISFFSVQVLCDILLIAILIRFGISRARALERGQTSSEPVGDKVKIRAVKKDKSENQGTED